MIQEIDTWWTNDVQPLIKEAELLDQQIEEECREYNIISKIVDSTVKENPMPADKFGDEREEE